MGCLFSKTVRCSRCYRSGDADDFVLDNNSNSICRRCIRIQQEVDYSRRLAALRDESSTSSASFRLFVAPGASRQTSQSQAAVTQRRSVVKSVPRYTTQSKTVTKTRRKRPARPKPLYGEYKCSQCGHLWSSRRSWANMYQKCQTCGKRVYPHLQRELRKSDMSNTERPHPEHLCEKCIQLGYHCGKINRS